MKGTLSPDRLVALRDHYLALVKLEVEEFGVEPTEVALPPVSDPLDLRLSSFVSAPVVRGSSPISGWNLAAQTPVGPLVVVLRAPHGEDPVCLLEALCRAVLPEDLTHFRGSHAHLLVGDRHGG